MSEVVDWTGVRGRIATDALAARFYRQVVTDLDRWIERYDDRPERKAGWYHDYVCAKCSARLDLDLEQPHDHLCPACGARNRGEQLDNAWNNMYRGRANANVYAAAVLYRIDEQPRYLEYIRTVVRFYATSYDAFDNEAVTKAFEGKIMNQHLDDAVGMMSILLGLTLVRDRLDAAELAFVRDRLFLREAELFDFFASRIYNIPVWITCAEAAIGVFFERPDLIERAFRGPFGVLDQLARGVTADGLWYEGSNHYHFYALQPLLYLLFVCRSLDVGGPDVDRVRSVVERMLVYPLTIVFENGRLPNPNDSHPLITLDRYSEHYQLASALFDAPFYRTVCATLRSTPGAAETLSSLLFDDTRPAEPATRSASVCHAASYTAMLRSSGTEVFVKYGLLTTLHAHPDVMNFELAFDGDVVSFDLGSGGYASRLFAEWQRLTPSHNTVVTDMRTMRMPFEGIVERFDPEAGLLRVKAKGVYEAVNYARQLRAGELSLEDRFEIDARGEHVYDWFFYCTGTVHCVYATEPVAALGSENGYQHLFDITTFTTDAEWTVDFVLQDKAVRVTMQGFPGTEVFIVNSYTDSTERTRRGLMVRRRAERTVFDATYRCIRRSTGQEIDGTGGTQ